MLTRARAPTSVRPLAAGALLAAAAAGVVACSSTTGGPEPVVAAAAGQAEAGERGDGGGAHALHNVHELPGSHGRVISGAVPEGDAAFDELARLGVRTIISVDGATPDAARARARGMRYVHVPVTYADISPEQQLEIARAVHDLPGPVYLHCHHGKHRGPAAAAAAGIALGYLGPEQGVSFMKTAGTAVNYRGLYASVGASGPASEAELAAAPTEFPEVRRVEGLVAAMVQTDLAFEHLREVREAGWSVPRDHPDLVPAAEAGRLTDALRISGEDSKVAAWGPAYQDKLRRAIEAAARLEDGLLRGAAVSDLNARFERVAASCKDCHRAYRDNAAE